MKHHTLRSSFRTINISHFTEIRWQIRITKTLTKELSHKQIVHFNDTCKQINRVFHISDIQIICLIQSDNREFISKYNHLFWRSSSLDKRNHNAFPRRGMQQSEMSTSAWGLCCQGCRHGCSRAAIRSTGAEAMMRVCRAPSQNPRDCLHVSTEKQSLFNEEIP